MILDLNGIVNHGPIVDRQQMFIGDFGEREQPGSKSAGKYNASHLLDTPLIIRDWFVWFIWLIWLLWLVSFIGSLLQPNNQDKPACDAHSMNMLNAAGRHRCIGRDSLIEPANQFIVIAMTHRSLKICDCSFEAIRLNH